MKRIHRIGLISQLLALQAVAQVYLEDYSGYITEGRAVSVHAGSYAVRFIFYQPEILRADFLPTPSTFPDSSFVVAQDTGQAVLPSVTETDSTLLIASSSLTIRCAKYPLRFSYYDAGNRLLVEEPSSGGLATDGVARVANFVLSPEDHFYGTGERGIGLDLRGFAFDSYNTQVFGYGGALSTMNVNIPLLTSSRRYALLFDNTYKGRFDLGSTDPLKFFYRAYGGELTFYLIAGETIGNLLERYTWLTGRQPMPPRWALGYLQSKYGYRDESEARLMVETMRSKAIPCDAIIIDGYWFIDMGDFSWNRASWPDPFQMMSDFRDMGFKTIVITEPYIVTPSLNWGEVVVGGLLARNSAGNPYILDNWWSCGCDAGLLDMTNPETRSWLWSKHPGFFGDELAGIWTDLGEPERHPDDMYHTLGLTEKVHNIYDLLWAETVFNGFQNLRPNQRLFNLTRSGFAGIQRYGVTTWSGDVAKNFNALAVQSPMLLNMGMSGIGYHNSDIGGFCCGYTTPELYVRWLQYGALGPVMRAHGAGPAVGGQDTEPWAFGLEAEEISRDFIRLRYQLLPYMYTLARQNHETGMPLVRPLFFDDPADPVLSNHSSSFLLGDAMLVSPVVQAGQSSKDVYLPRGDWFSFWDDQVYVGSASVNVATPLDIMPIFVKAGSIIPRQSVMNYVGERPLDTLMVSVYPSSAQDASFTLYEDDGETLDYQTGAYAWTEFTQSITAGTSLSSLSVTIGATQGTYSGRPTSRVYLADVHGIATDPTVVLKNGVSIPERSSYDELRAGADGFFFDPAVRALYLHVPTVPDSSYELVAEGIVLSVVATHPEVPGRFELAQNYPNPFNSISNFGFVVSDLSQVTLSVYNILGEKVATIVNEQLSPGTYTRRWDASGQSSGVYFYRLTAGDFVQTKKLLLLR
jgi:alpha-glucosidase (family GH31 glycosyl hydrolase)